MKTIGWTNGQGVIVELSEAEARLLKRAQEALDGQSFIFGSLQRGPDDRDMSDLFKFIRECVV